jgi:hypothetical protein
MKALKTYSRAFAISLALGITTTQSILCAQQAPITQEVKNFVDEYVLKLFNDLLFNSADNVPFHVYADKIIKTLKEYREVFIEVLEKNGIKNPETYLNDLINRLEEIKFTSDYNLIVAELKKWAFIAPEKTAQFIEQHKSGMKLMRSGVGLKQRLSIPNFTPAF